MKRLILPLLVVMLTGVAGLGYLASQAIEDIPLVKGRAAVATSEHAERVKLLVQRYRAEAATGKALAEISVTGQDLESLLAFAARGVPSARADAHITPQGLEAWLTIGLPSNPLGRYLNFSFGLLPSGQGLLLSHITMGRMSFPPHLLLPLVGWVLDTGFGEGAGKTVISTVSAVRFSANAMVLTYSPDKGDSDKLLSRIAENEQLRIADPERVQIYFSRLQAIAAELHGGYVPLTRYIAPVFELAAARSLSGGGDTISENKAAILALAIYFGDERMAKLAGNSDGKYFSGSKLGSHNVSLKGRHDLVQHYLTSAGLQLAAGAGVANAIGEFKEIADSLRGGSGFSFSDIAGDRAGVVLAERAIDSKSAGRIQSALAGAKSENEFFPDITGLPDNMTQAEFERRYGDVESPRYLELMADIERRIALVPVYGGG